MEGGNVAIRLPGVQKGDMASRNFKPEVNVFSVRFSPTAQSWAAATTEGLLIYSLDRGIVFDPLNLSLEVTPKAARECLKQHEYSTALLMTLKLNEIDLIEEIIEQIPYREGKGNGLASRFHRLFQRHFKKNRHINWLNLCLQIKCIACTGIRFHNNF